MTVPHNFRSNFLDLHQLISGLTGEKMNLEAACKALGVEHGKVQAEQHGLITPEYIEYNRRDVQVTFELCLKALAEYDRHPFSPGNPAPGYKRAETQIYSTASMTKAYFAGMGTLPPMQKNPDFPKEVLGACMEAFYGGRAEANIIRCILPVVYTDYASMYPTVSALMELWKLLIAERVGVVDATAEVRTWLDELRPQDLMRPDGWPALVGIALVQPTEADLLPVRAKYGRQDPGDDDPNRIALAHPAFDRPIWYALADLAASKILTGKTPEVLRAIRFVPAGTQPGLHPTRIRGTIEVNPVRDDLFRRLIEERARVKSGQPSYDGLTDDERKWLQQSLKILANSIYGVLVEVNKQRLPEGKKVPARVWHGQGSYPTTVAAVEQPGKFFFPPLGALITAAARLMLALLEWHIGQRGGSFAFCDTDSMAIAATKQGGVIGIEGRGNDGQAIPQKIKALSWREVEEIAQVFESLNPYDRSAIPGSILKIEDVNFRDGRQVQLHAFVAGTKRYAIFEHLPHGEIRITDQYSEHGLGHVLSPKEVRGGEDDWRRQVWEYIVRRELGLPAELPDWADYPAVGRHAITVRHLMESFKRFNQDKPYEAQVKPFNFMCTVLHDPFTASRFKDGLRLIGPFEPNPEKWLQMKWLNLHGEEILRLARGPYMAEDEVGYQTYRDLIEAHPHHKETKRTGPDGLPCEERARGLLGRRTVRPLRIDRIGKEADRHEERDLAADLDDLITGYGNLPGEIEEQIVRPALRTFLHGVADATGIDPENLRKITRGKRKARSDTSRRIVGALAALCATELNALGIQPPRRRLAAIKLYLDLCKRTDSLRQRTGEGPGLWDLIGFTLDNLSLPEIAKGSGISVVTLKAIRDGATPTATPSPALVAACAKACRPRLRHAGPSTSRPHLESLQLYRGLREGDLARLASMEEELRLLEAEQRADPHARFRYWHDLTDCWKRPTVRTRYRRASLENPRGQRGSWAKLHSVESILNEACAELGEDLDTFTSRVCHAVHERPRRIAEFRGKVRDLWERLAEGRLLPRTSI